ncbi:MAG: MATE family efflux transporter [Pseudomonadota bacterium]
MTAERESHAASGSRPGEGEAFLPRLMRHLSDLLRLAWPVMLSRAGILVMAFADIAMLGRYQVGAAGEANLGIAIFVPVLVFCIGLASGVVPVVSQAAGRGDRLECGRAWRRAMVWAAVTSAIGALVVFRGEWLLGALGQTPTLAAAGGRVAEMLAPGLVAQVLFAVCAFYLEATRRPMTALLVMLGANLANVALNWLLIWGHWGLPEMGAAGAALASTIVRWGAAGAMIAVILAQTDARGAGVIGPAETFWGPGGWRTGWPMRKLGISAGLSNGFETVGFAAMSLAAGYLGALALDAYSISHNLVSTVFMIGLGLAVATGVRVGTEEGRGRPDEAAFAGWCGFGAAAVLMGALALLVLVFRPAIAGIYTDDPAVVARVSALLVFSVLVFMPDSMQVVMGQAVRALGDAWLAIGIYAVSFTVLLVPLGLYLALETPLEERGLVVAIAAVCVLATVLMAWRFRVLTLRTRGRLGPPRRLGERA